MEFAWSTNLATGNTQIDEEHKKLIEAINSLLTACKTGQGREKLAPVITFLVDYTNTHFAHEELLQIHSRYPDRVKHKQYHADFCQVVNRLAQELKQNGANVRLVGEINRDLCNWLVNHIQREDVKLAQHIAAQG